MKKMVFWWTRIPAFFGFTLRKRRKNERKRQQKLRTIEGLEPRQLLTSNWTGGGSGGSWATPGNWSAGVPISTTTATISGLSTGGSITLDAAQSVNNLTIATNNTQPNVIAQGSGSGGLTVYGGLTVTGNQSKGISADINLAAAQTWTIGNTNGLAVSGLVSGATTFTKA